MQDDRFFMMSPMDDAGEKRLRQVREHIHKAFGPQGHGRCSKRTLEMPSEAPRVAKTPRTKLRQRIEQASQLSADQIFFQQFGSRDELINTEFDKDLVRPAGYPVSKTTSRRYKASHTASGSTSSASARYRTMERPTSYFSTSTTSTFTSSLPAPSTTKVNHLTRQLTRSKQIKTPRNTAIKRARAGESSAEKALVLRKPRVGNSGKSARTLDYTSTQGFSFRTQAALAPPPFQARKSVVTTRANLPSSFISRASPSKFQFSSDATRLFSQRQAPLR
ncbi:unnamed protein product [Peronospora belbahrii]|uniref:TPX2 central domain-containing protein n=1 Tax=Peronospora belbahrii TaxID=622444 RepID=A0AAU9L6F7_9STRA|nr:unnamed protein product [Peronospora belbahrii]CAH0520036.1 unnamed protein product [Peronospora belbahrii]